MAMSPNPPEPKAPAIAEAPITLATVIVRPPAIPGRTSGKKDVPHGMPTMATRGLDEAAVNLAQADFGDPSEEPRRAHREGNDRRPHSDCRSDDKPGCQQEGHEKNDEQRGPN